jgi:serine/threonine-protein kinase
VIAIGDFLPAGTVLNDAYRIEGTIGEGGFAVVYRAVQVSTGQPVALKLLRADRLDPENAETELARFDLEMKVIGRSSHQSIVRLIDSGTVTVKKTASVGTFKEAEEPSAATLPAYTPLDLDNVPGSSLEMELPFLVMELLTGETLDDTIRRAPLPVQEAVDITISVLGGVHSLHEDGIVHRDLKPSNIFLNQLAEGEVLPKVLDFGLAKLTRGADKGWTKTNIIGTPQYIAPEQIQNSEINAKVDQHALGVILYEMLAGAPPYEGQDDLQVLNSVIGGKIVPLSQRAPHVPKKLEMAIFQAMSTSPQVRFDDLMSFTEALVPFASEEARADVERRSLRSGVKSRAAEGLAKTVVQD